jgi:ribosomal protein S18 acetylase RimI-like enzyme
MAEQLKLFVTMTIRKANPADAALIRDLAWQIWPPTYSSILTLEQIDYMLNLLYSEKILKEQMEQGVEFMVVEGQGNAVGFASYGLTGAGIYKLHKIYVLPAMQGKGTGRFIIDEVIKNIKAKGATTLQLNVNRENNAKSFYERLGFSVVKEEDIDIGNGYFMNDYVMEIKVGSYKEI